MQNKKNLAIDDTQRALSKPLKCLFIPCGYIF